MATLLRDLDAFYAEHRRCGELDGGVEGESRDRARREEAQRSLADLQ